MVKGQMGSRGCAKTKFSSLSIQYRRATPQKIENGELFEKKIVSRLRLYAIFEICTVKGHNSPMKYNNISSL